MTLVVIGPVTHDKVVIGDESSHKIGGATYFQSFVFEEFYSDYLAIINCGDESLSREFPSADKVRVILKDNTHFFVNSYPSKDDLNVRNQLSNFADIPILKSDLESVLPEDIDAFVLNPLNRYDFPCETIEYLKSFNVPIFISVQGFLRVQDRQVNDNYTIKLDNFNELTTILSGVNAIFLDEAEENLIGLDYDVDEIVITDGSNGSRIVSDGEIRIDAVECDNLVDTTGCGDTYMAAYVSQKLMFKSSQIAGNFASKIASQKIENFGPYKFYK
ncbi:PfkB family carbohydrate kinase [Methanobrevibacter sp.]|uniref:PfkB family carbohydrate kinase n=1 Tax=Methanobrevibacter sp. TaxID=66852 RepID=UPI0025EABC69|nr:PfkB family carbohydrate kinase [Methanobrevibacter sp.]MBR4448416.1 ribokinase [Methanobrevibacter sp.]